VTPPRFLLREAQAQSSLLLPPDASHHAAHTIRLRPGMALRVFDGAGAEYDARVAGIAKGRVRIDVGAPVSPLPESPLQLCLGIAALKGDAMALVVQKATELGVKEVWPLVTERTDAEGRPALAGARTARWQRVAEAACEQCGRAIVPSVASAQTLAQVLARPLHGRGLISVEGLAEPEPPRPSPRPTSALALVGPPGGWSEAEVQAARDAGYECLGLGPRILRSETAGIVVVALLQQLWGDLSGR